MRAHLDLVEHPLAQLRVGGHPAAEADRLGADVGRGKTRSTNEKGVYNVIFQYDQEDVGLAAGKMALRLLNNLIYDKPEDFDYQTELEQRFTDQDRRIDRQGAMGAAMLNMAINAAGSQSPRGRIAVGAGFQGGERALSVGYGKRVGDRASFSLGGAFSGSERSAGVGFGVDL